MPQRPKVSQLPYHVRSELNRRLIRSNFSGYVQLSAWLKELGFQISKSTLNRYGQKLKDQGLSAVPLSDVARISSLDSAIAQMSAAERRRLFWAVCTWAGSETIAMGNLEGKNLYLMAVEFARGDTDESGSSQAITFVVQYLSELLDCLRKRPTR